MLDNLLLEELVVQPFIQDYQVIPKLVDPLEGFQQFMGLQRLVVLH